MHSLAITSPLLSYLVICLRLCEDRVCHHVPTRYQRHPPGSSKIVRCTAGDIHHTYNINTHTSYYLKL